MTFRAAVLALTLIASQATAEPVEVFFELELHLRSFTVDADVLAGGRLLMREGEGGALVLERVLEHPWKLYRVSPLVGREEVKYATDVTLEPASNEGRARAEAEADARGRHFWTGQNIDVPFDQAFVFFVLGPPEGRFRIEPGSGGGVRRVSNHMTDRWLPDGLAEALSARPVEGYAYWESAREPPEWSPHAYDAFVKALALLQGPLHAGPARHRGTIGQVADVVETLLPKARGRFQGQGDVTIAMTLEADGVERVFEGTSARMAVPGGKGLDVVVSRRARLAPGGASVADEVRVEMTKRRELSLKLRVGFEPFVASVRP